MRRSGVVAVLVLTLLGIVTPAQATLSSPQTQQNAETWSLQIAGTGTTLGPFVTVEAFSGARKTVTLNIENTSDDVISLSIGSVAVSAPHGTLEYREAASPFDPSNWVTGDGSGGPVKVQAGASASIPVAFSVPNTAHGGDYPLGLVATDTISGAVRTIPTLLRIPGEDRRPQLEATSTMSIDGESTWPLTSSRGALRYELRNTGTTVVTGTLELSATTLFSRSSQIRALEDVVVLPGDTLNGVFSEKVHVIGIAAPSMRFVADGWEPRGGDPVGGWEQRFRGDTVLAAPLLVLAALVLTVLGAGTAWAFIKRREIRRTQDASEA